MGTSRNFSLLEIMAGLALLLMAAGAIGWKMRDVIEIKRFRADLEQLKSRVLTARKMAVNMQADWEGVLKSEGKNWTFEAVCLDPLKSKSLPPLNLRIADVVFDGKKQSAITFAFFSSGEIRPSGALSLSAKDGKTEKWELPAIFGKDEGDGGKKLGPVRPERALE